MGNMKTTLELPDELVRRIKMRAVERKQKLNDTIAQLLELRFANVPKAKMPPRVPKPVRLKRQGLLTINDIKAAITAGRERYNAGWWAKMLTENSKLRAAARLATQSLSDVVSVG